jgi:hypothetical protein
MNIQCVKATTVNRGSESETTADLLLADYGLVLCDIRFMSDREDHVGAVVLPREQVIEDGRPVTRDVLQFTSVWDEAAFVALASKTILLYQGQAHIPR